MSRNEKISLVAPRGGIADKSFESFMNFEIPGLVQKIITFPQGAIDNQTIDRGAFQAQTRLILPLGQRVNWFYCEPVSGTNQYVLTGVVLDQQYDYR